MNRIPEPTLRVFYSKRKSITISRTEARQLLDELRKWLEPPTLTVPIQQERFYKESPLDAGI